MDYYSKALFTHKREREKEREGEGVRETVPHPFMGKDDGLCGTGHDTWHRKLSTITSN